MTAFVEAVQRLLGWKRPQSFWCKVCANFAVNCVHGVGPQRTQEYILVLKKCVKDSNWIAADLRQIWDFDSVEGCCVKGLNASFQETIAVLDASALSCFKHAQDIGLQYLFRCIHRKLASVWIQSILIFNWVSKEMNYYSDFIIDTKLFSSVAWVKCLHIKQLGVVASSNVKMFR